MSDGALAPLDAGRADVLPGYILSKPRLQDFGAMEKFYLRRYTESVLEGAEGLSAAMRETVATALIREMRHRPFALGRRAWDEACHDLTNLPQLLYACLRVKHPQLKVDEAAAMITDANVAAVQAAVLELWGYDPLPKKAGSQPTTPNAPSTGEASPAPSSNVVSPSTSSPTSP